MSKAILNIHELNFPWRTQDPFLFCAYHLDYYPKGNNELGPDVTLAGRNLGNDFVIKDGFRMYHGQTVPGFPVHPHRGFETITYVVEGLVDHADSNKASGRYGNGDVQWMTAGKGLQHSEMFPLLDKHKKNTFELFQIWLNLPANKKFAEPAYKMLWNEEIPRVLIKDQNQRIVEVSVVAGNVNGIQAPSPAPDSWAANSENKVNVWQIKMEKNAVWELPTENTKVNRSIYFFEGESLQLNAEHLQSKKVIDLNANEKVVLQNGDGPSRLLLLQGKPMGEEVVQYGPFVMNSMAEIEEAFADFRKTHFGGWPWPRPDMVHGKDKIRFARFADGEEIIKNRIK